MRADRDHEQPIKDDWWDLAQQARELVQRDLNGREMPDIVELIHQMREERTIQILSTLVGEEEAIRMVREDQPEDEPAS